MIVGDFNAPCPMEFRHSGHLPDLTLTNTSDTQTGSTPRTPSRYSLRRAPDVDNHLMNLWEARRSLTKRWRRQKRNRKLRARISDLTQQAAEYAAQLADTNWVDRCNSAARQMSSRNTWRLFRSLIDPTQTRSETQNTSLAHYTTFQGNTEQLANALRSQYLNQIETHEGWIIRMQLR
ncbi:hypothetical protein HPB49_016558 [Dermacentor silvarum]|uniref:Uncharacterized protein n=1 Tax=Dermacentor silvarum TaxID=543639 RepID=A0ACB8DPR0_DERSI|nr:hypothetical protein HPB49_016558 [Dermacentor silvarum]